MLWIISLELNALSEALQSLDASAHLTWLLQLVYSIRRLRSLDKQMGAVNLVFGKVHNNDVCQVLLVNLF